MILWTQHKLYFAIESTPVDHTKSDYYKDIVSNPDIQKTYHRLFQILETDKIIWCSLKEPHHKPENKIMYKLEVPEKEIVAFIVECAWHKLISSCSPLFYNRDCRNYLWERERNVNDYKAYFEQQEIRCYLPEPEEQLWNRLFWPQPATISCPAGIIIAACQKVQMCSALIKSPINKEWIIGKC